MLSREPISVEYVCDVSQCCYYFGDPDASRDFDLWCSQVRIHMHNFHNIGLAPNAYLNDLLHPVYSTAHGHNSSATPADRASSCS
jgi:hypothetical protein